MDGASPQSCRNAAYQGTFRVHRICPSSDPPRMRMGRACWVSPAQRLPAGVSLDACSAQKEGCHRSRFPIYSHMVEV